MVLNYLKKAKLLMWRNRFTDIYQIFSKVFDRVVRNQLVKLIQNYNKFTSQFGFQKNKSTKLTWAQFVISSILLFWVHL